MVLDGAPIRRKGAVPGGANKTDGHERRCRAGPAGRADSGVAIGRAAGSRRAGSGNLHAAANFHAHTNAHTDHAAHRRPDRHAASAWRLNVHTNRHRHRDADSHPHTITNAVLHSFTAGHTNRPAHWHACSANTGREGDTGRNGDAAPAWRADEYACAAHSSAVQNAASVRNRHASAAHRHAYPRATDLNFYARANCHPALARPADRHTHSVAGRVSRLRRS